MADSELAKINQKYSTNLKGISADVKQSQELYEDIYPIVLRRARLYARQFASQLDLQDLAGEAMVAIHGSLNKYDPEKGPFLPWIDAIVRNVAVRQYRKNIERMKLTTRLSPESPPAEVLMESSESYDVTIKEALAEVTDELSPLERELLFLILDHRNTYEAMAAQFGISLNTLYTRRSRLMQKLKKSLEKRNVNF